MAGGDEPESSPVDHTLADGDPQRVGSFRFYFADQRWEWSPQVAHIHGYEPAPSRRPPNWCSHTNIPRTTVRSRPRWRRSADVTGLSTRHRIIDVAGKVHDVVVVADRIYDDDGAVIGTHGFYVE